MEDQFVQESAIANEKTDVLLDYGYKNKDTLL
jgi:hypothetical protein